MSNEYIPNRYAAMIVFKDGTSEAEVKATLAKISEMVSSSRCEHYDDEQESPTLYFP